MSTSPSSDEMEHKAGAPDPRRAPGSPLFQRPPGWLHGGFAVLGLFYFLIFLQTTRDAPIICFLTAVSNVLPAWALSLAVIAAVRSGLARLPRAQQIALHLPIGLAYSAVWYMLLNVCLALMATPFRGAFVMRVLTGPVLYWQCYQGLLVYGFVALAATFEVLIERPHAIAAAESSAGDAGATLLVRRGELMHPVPIGDIMLIKGADDYCEVFTTAGAYLARVTLKTLMARLEGRRFVRVHRSYAVNLDHLAHVERVGGGRMEVQLTNGMIAPASRAGARLLKTLSI